MINSSKSKILAVAILAGFGCNNGNQGSEKDNQEIQTIQPSMGQDKKPAVDKQVISDNKPVSNDPRINAFREKFESATWEYDLLDFLESKDVLMHLELDKIPFEGDELPADAEEQLDNLSDISMTFPELTLEVKAHTTQAGNKVDRAAKRATSKARALWVATKLNFRGLPAERLSSTGMADDELLEGIDPEDKKQRRIVVHLTKSELKND